MASGDGFSDEQRHRIDRAIRDAETRSRLEFSVFVGALEGDRRAYADALHSKLVAPDKSVLILIDPAARRLEVVTGETARGELTDAEVLSAIDEMTARFVDQDLVGGVERGIGLLADYAIN